MPICFHCSGNHNTSECLVYAQNKTTDAINKQNAMLNNRNKTLERIGNLQISAIESMNKELRDISAANERHTREIVDSIEHLEATMEWQHYEMMEAKREEINVLYSIADLLRNHLAVEYIQRIAEGSKNLKDGKIDRAITALNKAIDTKSDDPLVYIYLGHAYTEKNDLNNALDYFEEAYKTSAPPKKQAIHESYCLYLISKVHFCNNNFSLAISKINEAINLYPAPDYKYHKASCLAKQLN